uniref:Major capsid protein N-terminal domain-containing protein n=2 Tax=viral metagenome TaxID=1070528 RepID=A0A6M3XPL0_9ZZZZ
MYFQQRYLEESKTFEATSGLDTIDLPNKGLLSGIEMRVWGTCGTGADKPDVWLHNRLTKLELVVNGSKVVKSLSGDQVLADMLYKKTPLHSHDMKNMSGASCEEFFHINLGRHYHDLDYMLDLSKVNDPELRLEYDFTKTSHNGWTNGVAMSAAPSRSVILHILREAPSEPKGYLKTSEIYRFTSGVSKKENMTIPRGPLYSNLYLQSFYASQGLSYLLDKLELNFNNDAIIPVRVGVTELTSEIIRKYGLMRWAEQASYKGGQAYPMALEVGVFQPGPMGLVAYVPGYFDLWGQANTIAFHDTATGLTPYTGNVNLAFTLIGALPFSVAAIPYFDPWDERTWVDSKELGDFWLRVEENASGGTSAVLKLLADEVVTKYEI